MLAQSYSVARRSKRICLQATNSELLGRSLLLGHQEALVREDSGTDVTALCLGQASGRELERQVNYRGDRALTRNHPPLGPRWAFLGMWPNVFRPSHLR